MEANGVHVSVDLETLSRDPHAAFTEIGAVAFIPGGGQGQFNGATHTSFHVLIDPRRQINEFGRTVDPRTVAWWMEQEDRQRTIRALKADREDRMVMDYEVALRSFHEWLVNVRVEKIWANHCEFDIAILRDAYLNDLDYEDGQMPWGYRAPKDMQTFFEGRRVTKDQLAEAVDRDSLGLVRHDALSDAIFQARLITEAWSR